jgi:membrane-associated phospholipid phosphatase
VTDQRISHYRILRKLGEGGMGQVFLAEDTRLERKAALKLLPPEFAKDPERLARFRREAKTVASLNHPNIVTIYSVEETDRGPFLTMELVEGRTLDAFLRPGGLAPRDFFEIALPLSDALSAAHHQGVTHRDLKPGNIMVSHDRRVKILDFGLAKLLESDHESPRPVPAARADVSDGRIRGTIPYMSPEQFTGRPVDHRSDIFSFGIVLYEMATSRRPFHGKTSGEVVSSILRDDPPLVTELNAEIPPPIGRLIRRCLEKDPEDRFQSAADLRNELGGLMSGLGLVPGTAAWETSGGVATRQRLRSLAPGDMELHHLWTTRAGLVLMLVILATLNWVETFAESRVQTASGLGAGLGDQLAHAMQWLEAGISFERHDAASVLAIYGSSISYFFVFPLLGLGTALTLMRRPGISQFRVFSLAIVAVYLMSLPFFVFFPVPERWSHHGSDATLLSDLWSSKLIEAVRPISGLDNCFPSFHVSLVTVIVVCCYLFRVRLRTSVLLLGLTVLLSTFLLGIHWIPDIVAGVGTGVLGVAIARRVDAALAGGRAGRAG